MSRVKVWGFACPVAGPVAIILGFRCLFRVLFRFRVLAFRVWGFRGLFRFGVSLLWFKGSIASILGFDFSYLGAVREHFRVSPHV